MTLQLSFGQRQFQLAQVNELGAAFVRKPRGCAAGPCGFGRVSLFVFVFRACGMVAAVAMAAAVVVVCVCDATIRFNSILSMLNSLISTGSCCVTSQVSGGKRRRCNLIAEF